MIWIVSRVTGVLKVKSDKYLKIALTLTGCIIFLTIFWNILPREKTYLGELAVKLELENVYSKKIKKLIQEGKLSNKEAMFYE